MRLILALSALPLVLSVAVAQEPPRGAEEALAKVFERPAGERLNRAEVGRRFIAFFYRYPSARLGRLSYAAALRDFFAGDVDKAVTGLDAFLDKWKRIGDVEHRRMAGRIYLNGVQRALGAEKPDPARCASLARRAARFYRPTETVARVVRTQSVRNKIPNADLIYGAIRQAIAGNEESEAARGKTLAALGASVVERKEIVVFKDLVGFSAKDMDGKVVDTKTYRGKILVVDFWATWCAPCIREMPNVVAAHDRFHSKGVEFVGVSLDRADKAEAIRGVERRFGMKWPQIYDGLYWDARIAKLNGVSAVPCTYVLDRTGKTRFYRVNGQKLHDAIAQLLAEK